MNFIAILAAAYFLLAPAPVRALYAGPPPVLLDIAQCESGGQQYEPDGSVVHSPTNDWGLFQINGSHIKEAKALGYDIMTTEGNTAYAILLYNQEGTRPWRASEKCWSLKQAQPAQYVDNSVD